MKMMEREKYEAIRNVYLTLQAVVNVDVIKADEELQKDLNICKQILLDYMPYDIIGQGMNDAIEYMIEKEKEGWPS